MSGIAFLQESEIFSAVNGDTGTAFVISDMTEILLKRTEKLLDISPFFHLYP